MIFIISVDVQNLSNLVYQQVMDKMYIYTMESYTATERVK